MNRPAAARVVLVGCLSIFVACGSCRPPVNPDGGAADGSPADLDAGPDAGPSTPFARYCRDYAAAICAWMVACNEWSATDEAGCAAYTEAVCDDFSGNSIAHGYATYDAVAAAQCIAAISSDTRCDVASTSPCSEVVRGASTTGQACLTSLDCKRAGFDLCLGGPCAMTCQATGALGEPCTGGAVCLAGAWCDSTNGLCRAPQPAGSPCDSLQAFECDGASQCDPSLQTCAALPTAGQSCGSLPCAVGAWCDTTQSPPVCVTDPSLGQTCSASEPCAPGTWCQGGGGSPSCATLAADGGTCSSTLECGSGLVCRSQQCLPPAGENQPCAATTDCQFPFRCDRILARCAFVSAGVQGEPCSGDVLTCVGRTNCKNAQLGADGGTGNPGTCQAAAVGDPCTSGLDCPIGTTCLKPDGGGTGVCLASSTGSTCTSDSNCPVGQYCNASNPPGSCQPKLSAGQPCTPQGTSRPCTSALSCQRLPSDAGSSAVCTTPGSLGGGCATSSACLPPLRCSAGTCVEAGAIGEPCSEASPGCYVGACEPDAGRCGSLRSNGQACAVMTDCQSGTCLAGFCEAACP